jgi:DNA-directed RNA polymerase specialized sigma24 family protein
MNGHEFLRAQRDTRDLWPRRFLQALAAGIEPDQAGAWLPELTRRFRSRVPDFAGAGLFATLMRTEGLDARDLADYILEHVFLALGRNHPREEGAFVDYVRRCVRSVAVTLRRQSLDSLQRAAARDGEVQILSLDEHPMLAESLAGDDPDAAAKLSDAKVVDGLLARAERDGQRANVEIVLRSALDDVALADIAREKGVSRQAIAKRYQRGLAYLQRSGRLAWAAVL